MKISDFGVSPGCFHLWGFWRERKDGTDKCFYSRRDHFCTSQRSRKLLATIVQGIESSNVWKARRQLRRRLLHSRFPPTTSHSHSHRIIIIIPRDRRLSGRFCFLFLTIIIIIKRKKTSFSPKAIKFNRHFSFLTKTTENLFNGKTLILQSTTHRVGTWFLKTEWRRRRRKRVFFFLSPSWLDLSIHVCTSRLYFRAVQHSPPPHSAKKSHPETKFSCFRPARTILKK